mmetsp:Transcript_57279/g.166188  ORF Transcript_57279/g.166188 Transcript_57279/m.166188 type:complete len:202 (+) Transcript_57279:1864-2469(+)
MATQTASMIEKSSRGTGSHASGVRGFPAANNSAHAAGRRLSAGRDSSTKLIVLTRMVIMTAQATNLPHKDASASSNNRNSRWRNPPGPAGNHGTLASNNSLAAASQVVDTSLFGVFGARVVEESSHGHDVGSVPWSRKCFATLSANATEASSCNRAASIEGAWHNASKAWRQRSGCSSAIPARLSKTGPNISLRATSRARS